MTIWHTAQEKRILKKIGAKLHHHSYDGIMPDGRFVEIRSCRQDNRYRLDQTTHQQLMRTNGFYIFVNNGQQKRVSAQRVNNMLPDGAWYKDRKYPHKFVRKKQIF